jgi:signal transduction histidine kinase
MGSDAATPARAQPGWLFWVATALLVWLASSAAVLVLLGRGTNTPPAGGVVLMLASTALATVLVGLVLRRSAARQGQQAEGQTAAPLGLGPIPLAIRLAFGVVLAAGLVLSYWLGWNLVEESLRNRLKDVATIQRSYMQAWIQGERSDLQNWAYKPIFGAEVTLKDDQSTPPEVLLQQVRTLNALAKERDYESVTLRDPATGKRWVSSGNQPDSPADIAQALDLARSPPAHERSRLARPESRDVLQQELKIFQLMTVTAGGQQAVLQIDIDVEDLFLRHIGMAMDPIPDSVNTLLVQRMGDGVVILNDSAVRAHGLSLRTIDKPPSDSIWTALHLQQDRGFAHGKNADGAPVLAYSVPVEQTNWMLVTQIEESRVYGRLNWTFLIGLMMAGSVLLLAMKWWQTVKRQSAEIARLAAERAQHAEQVANLSHQVVSAQEAERHQLAMELHDHIGADLSAIGLNLKFIERSFGDEQAQASLLIQETHGLLADTVLTIRDFCTQLRPSVLDHAGLEAALQTSTEQLHRRTGIQVSFSVVGMVRQRPPALELALFRIVQEALLNCERHAAARKLRIEWREDASGLSLEIEDDGKGFDPSTLGKTGRPVGHGMSNMRDRAQFLGGTFHVRSTCGEGTCIYIHVPHP